MKTLMVLLLLAGSCFGETLPQVARRIHATKVAREDSIRKAFTDSIGLESKRDFKEAYQAFCKTFGEPDSTWQIKSWTGEFLFRVRKDNLTFQFWAHFAIPTKSYFCFNTGGGTTGSFEPYPRLYEPGYYWVLGEYINVGPFHTIEELGKILTENTK